MPDLQRITSVSDLRTVTTEQRAALDLTFAALYTELALYAGEAPEDSEAQAPLSE